MLIVITKKKKNAYEEEDILEEKQFNDMDIMPKKKKPCIRKKKECKKIRGRYYFDSKYKSNRKGKSNKVM